MEVMVQRGWCRIGCVNRLSEMRGGFFVQRFYTLPICTPFAIFDLQQTVWVCHQNSYKIQPFIPIMGGGMFARNIQNWVNQAAVLDQVDFVRFSAVQPDEKRRAELGQFMTPAPVAAFMASLFRMPPVLRLLDAGAGIGALSAAVVDVVCAQKELPKEISITAYEIDAQLIPHLKSTLEACKCRCDALSLPFTYRIIPQDFIHVAVSALRRDLFCSSHETYNFAILNPPYRKIQSASEYRKQLRSIGIETSNLYTAFLALVEKLLEPGGQLVAITPRSFCNGPYFKPFRTAFLEAMALQRIHLFTSRQTAFSDDEVLQENIVFHATKTKAKPPAIVISSNQAPGDEPMCWQDVSYDTVVQPDDPHQVIHIVTDDLEHQIFQQMAHFQSDLDDLGISVSTGRVVDFRAREFIRQEPEPGTVPLIYPCHFREGYVAWPCGNTRKPNAIVDVEASRDLLVPTGMYVLVKRFSAREEKRRIVAALFDPNRIPSERVGFENHLNYFHCDGQGLDEYMAKGLTVFLNSRLVDIYFRLFNGHTQVNATDLRCLRYPTPDALMSLGRAAGEVLPDMYDELIAREVFGMADEGGTEQPVKAKKKIEDALDILKIVGMPRAQQNERSALTLLALMNVRPDTAWRDASNPLIGITPIMDFAAEHYGKRYAPNTRETVRRQTVHQFLDAGLILINPDVPSRPTNSPHTVYQIEPTTLALIQAFGSPQWDEQLKAFSQAIGALRDKYAQERMAQKIPVDISSSVTVNLSPGGQNQLVKKIIDEMFPFFVPGGKVIYLGDTADKMVYFDRGALERLGVDIEDHGKMPDVVIHHVEKNWLLLIEAVTSHGPVDPKRRGELTELFKGSKAGLVFVTAFLSRSDMVRYLGQISWETEVWVAESPTHMIHFNGERFLGPYE